MKKSIVYLFILTTILSACAPQVTVTLTSTPPSPTDTPIPTPTVTPITVNMSETDKQIWDAAPEIEGIKKEMSNLWGVVGVDENGNTVAYWDFMKYNYDRGDWLEVVREENGHLVVLDAKGEERIVYPERIAITVNGEELTLNTTARNYLENRIPDTPGAKLEIAKELIRLSDEGYVLPKLAEDGMTLKDFWVKETFNANAIIAPMFTMHSTEWKDQRPDQLPATRVIFPHIIEGEMVEGVYEAFTTIKQEDMSTGGYWSIVINYDNRLPHAQQILDNDVFKQGGKSAVIPRRYKDLASCILRLGEEMSITCEKAMADLSVAMDAIRESVNSGKVDKRLWSGEITVFAAMDKVAD